MAEGLFKDMLKKNKISGIHVSSAGISVFPGEDANEKSIKALIEKGIDIKSHRAKQLSDEILNADLLLTMTSGHKDLIEGYFIGNLEKRPKVFTLKEFASKISGEKLLNKDIADPFGRSYSIYLKTRDEIEGELVKILKNIDKLEEV